MHGIFLNKNLVFIESMQFMNSSLEKLVKNLSEGYLTEEYGSKNLVLLKQKSYGYKLVCVDYKFRKPLKPWLDKDAV